MKYTLMHKDIEVADVEIDTIGTMNKIYETKRVDHMPYGTTWNGTGFIKGLALWWKYRSIPASRGSLQTLMETLGFDDTSELLTKSFGLSLSDQYWIKPEGAPITWAQVNFFENPFSEDVGDLLFGEQVKYGEIDLISPDNTSEGNLKKKWKIIDGERCLLKSGSTRVSQEPYNEVIASKILDVLGIEHTEYSLIYDMKEYLSSCGCFVDTNTEFISADRAMKSVKNGNEVSKYTFYVKLCADHGLDIVPFLDRMITFDYLVANTDRHLNNFGIIRDVETLEWLKPAPLFDNGGSLWYDFPMEDISPYANIGCKPFKETFREQLDLVTSFDWLDTDKLDDIIPIVRSVFTEENGWHRSERTERIVECLQPRIARLKKVAGVRRSPGRTSAMFLSESCGMGVMRWMLRSKIHRATVTQTRLDYEGSITVDEDLLDRCGIWVGEKVTIADVDNGSRFETYTLPGERGSGIIAINGAAAHLCNEGDKVIIMAYELVDEPIHAKVLLVDSENKVARELIY